jgi:hypothetical protein
MKTYINVMIFEKDRAKALGARFDMSRKQWYVPDGIDLEQFKEWLPKELAVAWRKLKRKKRSRKNRRTS